MGKKDYRGWDADPPAMRACPPVKTDGFASDRVVEGQGEVAWGTSGQVNTDPPATARHERAGGR